MIVLLTCPLVDWTCNTALMTVQRSVGRIFRKFMAIVSSIFGLVIKREISIRVFLVNEGILKDAYLVFFVVSTCVSGSGASSY